MQDTIKLRSQDVSWRDVGDEIVVLDLRASNFLELNRSGVVLWRRLAEGPASEDELSARLVEVYGIDGDRAGTDVRAFVKMLRDVNLLEA